MSRRLHIWKIRSRDLTLGERTLIVGILNVTPDSFSDGGDYLDPDRAYARAMQLEEDGADIIDIGAESTRPGAHPVTAAEELQRLVPVLKRLRDKLSVPISVDTYKAEVAERALELGVDIINDPSGFTLDPLLAKPIVQYDAGVIFNHMRGRPETWASLAPMPDVMGAIVKDLDASVNRARRSGVDRARIVIDPGIGFGKRREQNAEILARLGEMTRLELPIMVGASRKSFLAQSTERGTEFATAAAVTASILRGAHLVRVHDVAAMKAAVTVADEIQRASQRLQEAREAAAGEQPSRRTRPSAQSPQVGATASRPPVRPPLFTEAKAQETKPPEPAPERLDLPRGPIRESSAPRPSANFRKPPQARSDSKDRPARRPNDFERRPSRPPSESRDRPPRPPSNFRDRTGKPPGDSKGRPSRPPSGDFKTRPSRPPSGDFKSRPPRPPSESGERPSRPPSNFSGDPKGRPFKRSGDTGRPSGPSKFRPRPGGGGKPGPKGRPAGPRKGGPSKPPFRPKPRRDE